MRKFYLVIVFLFVVLAAINTYYFISLYNMQVTQQKNVLLKQSDVCVGEIEFTLNKFQSDLNFILYSDDISRLFEEEDSDALRKLQLFYSTYHALIKNIDIYDNNKNVLNLFRDRKQNFITDRYLAQRQRKLIEKDDILKNKNEYQYVLPVYKENLLFANILVTINVNDYILTELNKFRLDDITWQWVIDLEDKTFSNTGKIKYEWKDSSAEVLENLNLEFEGIILHNIGNDSIEQKVLTVYKPVKFLSEDLGIALSIDHYTFLTRIFAKVGIVSGLSLVIFILACIYLINHINLLKKKTAH